MSNMISSGIMPPPGLFGGWGMNWPNMSLIFGPQGMMVDVASAATIKTRENGGTLGEIIEVLKGRFRFEQPTAVPLLFTAYALLYSDWWFRAYAVLTFIPTDRVVLSITSLNATLAGHLLFKAVTKRGGWLPFFVALGGVCATLVVAEYRLWNPAPEQRDLYFYSRLISDMTVIGLMNSIFWNFSYVRFIVWYDIGAKLLTKVFQVPVFGDHNPRDENAARHRKAKARPYLNVLQVGLTGMVVLKVLRIL